MTITEMDNLFMNEFRATQEYQLTMAQAVIEAEDRYNKEMAEIEELFPEDLTVEDIEIELASINDYRDEVLDISVDETEWINDNVKLSKVLGDKYEAYNKKNIIDILSIGLKMHPDKVKCLIRKGLGIKKGSEYQNMKRKCIENLIANFNDGSQNELLTYLEKEKTKLYNFYRALLEYIRQRVSLTPLSKDEDELSFYVIYNDLRKVCVEFNIVSGLSDSQLWSKLNDLCNLGLLDNLTSDRIDDEQLRIAENIAIYVCNEIKENTNEDVFFNRRNFYVLNDLSPTVQQEAIDILKLEKECHLRKKQRNATTLAMVHGVEHQKKVTAQGEPSINPTKLRNFTNAANILLKKQGYYTEKQLRIQYCKKDKSIKKKDAIVLTAEYLSKVVLDTNCITARVNKDTREYYKIPDKIKSNSIIFVPREDN